MSELGIGNFADYYKDNGKIFGVMVGVIVKNNSTNDDSKPGPGLVKVKIPLLGMKESNWARISSFMAGKEMGAFFLPEEGDEVLIAFENGDVNKPFIIGSLWNGKEAPPDTNSDGKNNVRIIKSRSGHVIKLFDKKDEEAIEIKTKGGHIAKLDDKKDEGSIEIKSVSGHFIKMNDKKGEECIQIVDKSGENKIIINTKDKKIALTSAKDIEISAPSGNLTMKAKNIEMKSTADTKIEASAGVEVKASAKMTLKGATVNIN